MKQKFAIRPSVTVLMFIGATMLLSLSVVGRNSKGYNQAFNSCSQKMENAYADCLNMPYNSVAMCQNVASGVYKRCMRSKGYSVREGDSPPLRDPGTRPTAGDRSSPSPTPKHIRPLRPIDTSALPSVTPTPKHIRPLRPIDTSALPSATATNTTIITKSSPNPTAHPSRSSTHKHKN